MNSVWSPEVDKILGVGHGLADIGVNNWGLNKDAAFSALDALQRMGVPILGGDVYKVKQGIVRITYDGWFVDRSDGESKEDFVRRSIQKAKEYIAKYPEDVSRQIFFALVPDI